MKYWETIADNLSKAGWSWGCSSEVDSTGRVLFTADAYARDGRRFIVLSDEKFSAFLELERVGSGPVKSRKMNWLAFLLMAAIIIPVPHALYSSFGIHCPYL